jgi:hypothetical protein
MFAKARNFEWEKTMKNGKNKVRVLDNRPARTTLEEEMASAEKSIRRALRGKKVVYVGRRVVVMSRAGFDDLLVELGQAG